ncbi:MAG: sodium-dependent transporter [Gammaproteobacteria bacterium]|nr:sodium-dependent transporter [Gammaproteobacteria bacterium]
MPRDGSARVARWSSHRAFLFVAVGATVGLGNVWRFPGLVAEHGGILFVGVYLAALLLLAMPLLLAELALARRATGGLTATFGGEVRRALAAPAWRAFPWLVLGAAWTVLAVLVLGGSWLLAYLAHALPGGFAESTARGVALHFDRLAGSPASGLGWLTLFLAAATAISAAGIARGLERAMVGGLLVVVACWGLVTLLWLPDGRLGGAVDLLLTPDWDALGPVGVREALVQAFYTLTLGAGVMHALAVHLPPGGSLPGIAARIALGDTLFALLATLLVLAGLAAAGLAPTAGPRLLFESLPLALARLQAPAWIAAPLYLGFVTVAWMTTLALFEPLVLALADRRGFDRARAAVAVGVSLWVAGGVVLVSLAGSRGGRWVGQGPFGWLEYLGGHLLVPLVGLLMALFVGWLWPERARRRALPLVPVGLYRAWLVLLRYLVPAWLVLLLAAVTGILPGPP